MSTVNKTTSMFLAGLVAGALGLAAPGCGGGYDEEEAAATCDALVGRVATSGESTYQACIDCHMECGDDCAMLESFPPQFTCP